MATAGLFSSLGGDEASLQRQLDEQRAQAFAQQTQEQRLAGMGYKAGAGLGRGLAGAFGVDVTDPTIRQAAELRRMASEYDVSSPEGLMQMAQALRGSNPQMAVQLAEKAQQMLQTQSVIAKNMREKASADPFQKLLETGKYTPSSLKKYKDSGDVSDLELKTSDAKTQVVDTVDGQLLINSQTGEIISNIGKKAMKPSMASEIAAGLSPVLGALVKGQAQKAGEAGGTAVGKDTAAIQGKYTALNSVDDALNVVKKGIYAGGYGPLEEGLAKYSKGVLADKQRLVNTEEFRAYIGDVVIPRLTEFGGNDSVEELKYLKSVMAGETTMESKSIERILNNAKKKIQAGINRIQEQQKAIGEGKQLPTGPLSGKAQQRTTRSGVVYSVEGE
jgi:hypothetical protein